MSARDQGRRPIEDWERPYLTALGASLRELRTAAGLTQHGLSVVVGITERSLRRLERGERRTRRSTLGRFAHALAPAFRDQMSGRLLLDVLVLSAGAGLAPESLYQERVDARRHRRLARIARTPVTEHVIVYQHVEDGVLESHRHRRWVTRSTTRDSAYCVFEDQAGRRRRLPATRPVAATPEGRLRDE